LAGVDNGSSGDAESVQILLRAGRRYVVLGEGWFGDGLLDLEVQLDELIEVPPNDACRDALPIDAGALPTTVTGDTTNAANDGPAVGLSAGGSPDVFWSFTPSVSGFYGFTLAGAFDVALAILDGDCATFSTIAESNDGGVGQQESVTAQLEAGHPYLILVAGADATAQGLVTLSASSVSVCDHVRLIPPTGGVASAVTSGHSLSGGTCGGNDAPEQAFEWTPLTTGYAQIGTCGVGTPLDTLLYVREGACRASGGELFCVDDACRNRSGFVLAASGSLFVQAGHTYTIIVDAFGTQAGAFQLQVVPPSPGLAGMPPAESCGRVTSFDSTGRGGGA
jgi:hypothetical protein